MKGLYLKCDMEKFDKDLIIGYLQETLSEVDKLRFYDWINESKENKDFYFDLKTVYDASVLSMRKYDIEKSWKKLLKKRRIRYLTSKPFYVSLAKYAAIILLTVSTTIFFQNLNKTNSENVYYKSGNGIVADKITLPDGTEVSLSSNTSFSYNTQYNKDNRTVYLEGEGFFNVIHQTEKPFIVKIKNQEIQALGTKFNVKSYENDSVNVTILVEGSVSITTNNKIEKSLILSPNQQLIYYRDNDEITLNNVTANTYANWIKGYYNFDGERLEDIFTKLSELYGLHIIIQNPQLKDKNFRGTFYRGQSIKDILEIINLSIKMDYIIEENKIFVR